MEMTVQISIDGRAVTVAAGDNLLRACLSLGYDLPYFCWHPALGSVGACRQCAVKQIHGDGDRRSGRIVMACMTPVAEGMRIAIADPEARAFRAGVIEWLMTNHPHDCPVCPEGGECHLQDMTVMTGHVRRRYRFTKRTFRNQYLGPFLQHEMNRCIACYRCVRFYRDYAGGRDFDVFATHRDVYFGRHADGVLDSEFAGNLAEICPTGVFTDKPLETDYARKWDLRGAPSLCVHCGLGCNTTVNARAGRLRRVLNRYHPAVNGYFLCDRGRFGHGFTTSGQRLRAPLLRGRPVPPDQALARISDILAQGTAIGIGSPRASLEANFALRHLVGPANFHLGLPAAEARQMAAIRRITAGPVTIAPISEAERADAVLVLGEDLPNTAPRLALALRQAVREGSFVFAETLGIPRWHEAAVRTAAQPVRSPLIVATPAATRLDDVAARAARLAPDDIARLGFAIAHALDGGAPAVPGLPADLAALAEDAARALAEAHRPLVVTGTGCASSAVIEAAANITLALHRRGRPGARFHPVVPACNSQGLALMGGRSLDDALAALAAGTAETLIALETDLYRCAAAADVDTALAAARHVIVLDQVRTPTTDRADIILPAAAFAEADGTLVSNEGRAQRFVQAFVPAGAIRESWSWLRDAGIAAGRPDFAGWTGLDEVTAACAHHLPDMAAIVGAAPPASFRIAGARIAREPSRTSGRTALAAEISVHEAKPPDDPDTPLAFTMEGYYGPMPPALLPYAWAPGWNSVQAINKFQQEVGGDLLGGPPGCRLIEPRPDATASYGGGVPAAFAARAGQWLIVPMHEVFGSDELSRLAPAVAERVPAPYLALADGDAARLGLGEGDAVILELAGASLSLTARIGLGLPGGLAGLFPALPALPAWGIVAKGSALA